MAYSPAHQIEVLTPAIAAVQPEDSMAESGRKILLAELVLMLNQESGSRSGADIEHVHDMRVAIRRMRSAIRLLNPYLKGKAIKGYNRNLRQIGLVLGDVRDLDVVIDELQAYAATLDADGQTALQPVLAELEKRRQEARINLNACLDTKTYRRFVKAYCNFLLEPTPEPDRKGSVTPYQVRHVLPMLIADRLAVVRAYETVLAEADAKTLHALRIEFKRLRYLLSLFQNVLGSQADEVIQEIKTIQDHLGHLNDGVVARERLGSLLAEDNPTLNGYLDYLESQQVGLKDSFLVAWTRFNTRKVQQKLATAVLALH
ncbi:MAG TPA: CHAD domain-containing protein [Phototrophicaceae bacterium]|nr:CHAD domain-containing protein [Phototrophicaceae bacterium]